MEFEITRKTLGLLSNLYCEMTDTVEKPLDRKVSIRATLTEGNVSIEFETGGETIIVEVNDG